MLRLTIVTCALFAGLVLPVPAARAETHAEIVNEARIYLHFRVADAVAQGLLPSGWQPAPAPQDPTQGANLLAVLIDRFLAANPDGEPLDPATNCLLVLVVPGKDPASGAAGPVVVGGFSAEAKGAPGPYRNYQPATVTVDRASTAGEARETWSVSSGSGDKLTLELAFEPGTPSLVRFDQRTYSGTDPGFHRIYRGDQGVDLIRSTVTGVDRASRLVLTASGPTLGKLLDGSEELVAASSFVWYRRNTFLP
jgi:hypothetical protein